MITNRVKKAERELEGRLSDEYVLYDFDKEYKPLDNNWYVSIIKGNDKQRTGYPTQKPIKLLENVILSSSNAGDIILDPFCGCATACVASEKLDRQWIGIDTSYQAYHLVRHRLENEIYKNENAIQQYKSGFPEPIMREDLPERNVYSNDQLKLEMMTTKSPKHILYDEQKGLCNGCHIKFGFYNLTIDHIVPKSKGGGDSIDNLQLLCSNCNSVKGNRPMEHLQVLLRKRNERQKFFFPTGEMVSSTNYAE